MPFVFIDQNTGINRGARKLIRSHASIGHKAGKKRQSNLPLLQRRPERTVLKNVKLKVAGHVELAEDMSGLDFSTITLPVGDFMTFPGDLSPRSRSHVRNFLSQITHSMSSADLGGCIDTHVPRHTMWTENIFTNEAYFHASVAFSIAIFEPDAAGTGTDPDILRHFSESLRLVNERLSGGNALNDSTFIAIIGLSQYDRVQNRYSEALVHIQGLNRLALLRGGIAGLRGSPGLMQKLFRADLEIALYFGTATTFRAEDLPGQKTALLLRGLYKKDRARYCISQKIISGLDESLQVAFFDTMSLAAFASGRITTPTKLQLYPFHDTIILLGFRLLQIRPLCEPGLAAFETLLHLGMVAFLTTFLRNISGRGCNFMAIVEGLRSALLELYDESTEFQKLTIWAVLIGASVLFSEDDEFWLVARLSEASSTLDIRTWDSVEEILMQYPWIPLIHNRPAMRLWNLSQEQARAYCK